MAPQTKAPRTAKSGSASTSPDENQWWRNIHYSENEGDKRLQVRSKPDLNAPLVATTLALGDRFMAKNSHEDGNSLWLQLDAGWILARSDAVVNCVNMCFWKTHQGRVPETAIRGQNYPVGMLTEGFGGSSEIVVASASGDAFWRETNVEMLCRDISTMTLYEKGWEGDDLFQDWVAQYALNAAKYGLGKRFVVIVKPTCRWRTFAKGAKGIALEEITEEIGRAQNRELNWIFKQRQRLECEWEEIEFLTALAFLQKYCDWTRADCTGVANEKLNIFCKDFPVLEPHRCEEELNCTYWSWMEAFDTFPQEVKEEATFCHSLLQRLTREQPRPVITKVFDAGCATAWRDLAQELQSLAPGIYAKVVRSPTWCLIKEMKQPQGRQTINSGEKHVANELRFVISAGSDKVAQMWCPRTLAPLKKFEGHQGQIWSCCLSADEEYLITTSADGTAKLWSMTTGLCRNTYQHLPPHSWRAGVVAAPNWACVTADMRYLCTAVNDSTAKIFDVEKGVLVKELRHGGGVNSVCLSPDGLHLFTASGDRLGHMWRVPTGEAVRTFDGGHKEALYSCSLGPNGDRFFTASFDGGTTMFDVASGRIVRRFNGPGQAQNVWASSTGRHVFVGRGEGENSPSRVQVFDVNTGDLVREFHGHNRDITAQWVSKDETHLCTSSLDGTARVWNVSAGTEMARYDGHRGFVQCVTGAA